MELLLEEIRDQNRAKIELLQAFEVRLRAEIRQSREEIRALTREFQAELRGDTLEEKVR